MATQEMTTQEIYAILPDEYGWRKLPNGNDVHLENNVKLGKNVTLGNDVRLRNNVTLGNDVTLGNNVILRDNVHLGNYVTLGNNVHLRNYVTLGNNVILGDSVILGNNVKLGDGVTLENRVILGNNMRFDKTPLQIQCSPYIVYPHSETEIGVGCIVRPIEYWLAVTPGELAGELARHPECQPWSNYADAIDLVAKWMQAQGWHKAGH